MSHWTRLAQNLAKVRTNLRKVGGVPSALAFLFLAASLCRAEAPALSFEFADEGAAALRVNRMALAPRLSKPPRMDGRIEAEVWDKATTLAALTCAESPDPAPIATEVRVGCTEEALFIALTCDEPEAARMAGPSPMQRDQRVWASDGVEFLLDSINDRRRPKGVAISPTGALADFEIVQGQRNLTWDSGATAAAARTATGWSAEISLPRKRFDDPANGVIGFNVIRRRLGAFGAPYTWNPAPPQEVESPAWLGNLSFDTPPVGVQQVQIGWPHGGRNRFLLRLRNDTKREQRVRIGLATRPGPNAPDYSRYRVTLPASKTVEFALTHNVRLPGPHDFEFLLIDDETGRRITWFARRNVAVNASAIELRPQGQVGEGKVGAVFRVMLPQEEVRDAVVRAGVREAGQILPISETNSPLKARMGRVLMTGDVVGKELVVTVVRQQEMIARGVLTLAAPVGDEEMLQPEQ